MLDSKFFFTLVGLIITVFALCNTNMSPAINEGFWGVSMPRTVKVMREVKPNGTGCGGYGLQNNYQAMLGSEKFFSNPSFQGLLSPRMDGMFQPGANIRYNMPSYQNTAVPCDSLAMADMAEAKYGNSRENFGGNGCKPGCSVAKCGKGGVSLGGQASQMAPSHSISSDPNYTAAMDQVYNSDHTIKSIGDLLPVDNMTTVNSLGEMEQPIVYDRYIYANAKSNLYAQGCPIRGDLAIVPCSGNWFSVHPNPSIDLNPGAMNVMGGNNNDSTKAIGELINATSGGYKTAIAGVNMSNQFSTNTSALGGDIHVTGFI
jgi:hypothetical protein